MGLFECVEDTRWWHGSWKPLRAGFSHEKRRAVSSILAILILVAVALIASVAVSGFVFGNLSQSSHSSQIAVAVGSLPASVFKTGGGTATVSCATTSSGAYLTLTNAGSGRAVVTWVTITWAGTDNHFSVTGACTIGASGSPTATAYLLFPTSSRLSAPGSVDAVTGQLFTGTVSLSNGAQLLFTGYWE